VARPAPSGRGRPGLRTAAWRAIWGALRHNLVWSARHAHLTGRPTNRLVDGQARAAAAAALLRQLFVVITRRTPWDPAIAAGTTTPEGVTASAARCHPDDLQAGRTRVSLGQNPKLSQGAPPAPNPKLG
jgi:hypothetical protein